MVDISKLGPSVDFLQFLGNYINMVIPQDGDGNPIVGYTILVCMSHNDHKPTIDAIGNLDAESCIEYMKFFLEQNEKDLILHIPDDE